MTVLKVSRISKTVIDEIFKPQVAGVKAATLNALLVRINAESKGERLKHFQVTPDELFAMTEEVRSFRDMLRDKDTAELYSEKLKHDTVKLLAELIELSKEGNAMLRKPGTKTKVVDEMNALKASERETESVEDEVEDSVRELNFA